MNQEKLKRLEAEIAKTKAKSTEFTARLRELERQKTELENAGIVALVRDMAILPDELTAYIKAFKAQSGGGALLPTMPPAMVENTETDKEETDDKE